MSALPRNNAFGAGSPSWNLCFPKGNMTAAEIIAYLPHWLKSIDVVDRFVTNGARSATVSAIVNEFRHQPADRRFSSNSAQIMMSNAMRHGGYKNWTFTTHSQWQREVELSEANLSVKEFRPPCLTHPKSVPKRNLHNALRNHKAKPIPMKDLALHVKQHPLGSDALDLTRCVQYALTHEHEIWLFPTDFERLVVHLGGPQAVTHSHYDRQVFARRESAQTRPHPATRKFISTSFYEVKYQPMDMPATIVEQIPSPYPSDMPGTVSVLEQGSEGIDKVLLGGKRRSSRLAGKVIKLHEESDATVSTSSIHDLTTILYS